METEGFVQTDKAQRAAEEDEEDAEEWSDLERFQHFIVSEHALRRLVCVRGLAETIKGITCAEATSVALPLLEAASKDDESSVRDALASQLAPMVKALLSRANPSEAEQIMALVWPVTLTLLKDRDQQVRAGHYQIH
jgi:tRNA A37 threonylcarbamoyladenosine synthetase subunit TsaC/SUA5/YrdC